MIKFLLADLLCFILSWVMFWGLKWHLSTEQHNMIGLWAAIFMGGVIVLSGAILLRWWRKL